jgi:ABC-type sugar transport system ATPase subunit
VRYHTPYDTQCGLFIAARHLVDAIDTAQFEDLQTLSGGPVAAKVHDVENYATDQVVTLRVETTNLRASAPAHVAIKVEEMVRFGWMPDKALFFDSRSGLNIGRGS